MSGKEAMNTETVKEDADRAVRSDAGLDALLVVHPYYCSESNYYDNDAGRTWETMTDFLAEFESADVDMNLVFRWDIKQRDEENPGRCYAEVFMMHQRKGIFSPHHIKHINESEAERFRLYLEKHWRMIKAIWEPLSANVQGGALPTDTGDTKL